MTLTMYQADRNFVTPSNDASLYSSLVDDTNGTLNRGNKLGITVNGLIATVSTGQAVIQGRLVEVVKPENLTLPPNTTGKICLTVDLSKTNDVIGQAGTPEYSVKVNQVYLAVVTGDVLQDDLNNGGIVYQLPIGSFNSSTTTATVSVIKNVFNDTGWIDFELAEGATYNPGSYARYRVHNNIVYVRWYNISCNNTQNGNQVVKIPNSIKPNVSGQYVLAGSNINVNNGDHQFCNYIIPDVANPVGVIYGMWGANQNMSLTGATGSGQWPLGGNA